jgi:hypothetical protein
VKTSLLFAALTLIAGTCASMAAVSLTGIGVPFTYTQDFNTLASSGTSSPLPDGWKISEAGTSMAANDQYIVSTGSSTAGDTYSYGASSSSERALGSIASNTLVSTFGAEFTNNTGTTISGLGISFTGEMWRLGALGREDRLDFQNSLDATALDDGTGTWIDVNALDFIAPITGPTVGALDGNANQTAVSSVISGLGISQGATFWIRWNDLNASGADDGLAVDDFMLTAHGASVSTPEAGVGTLLTGLVLFGILAFAKALRLRSERPRKVPCPVRLN